MINVSERAERQSLAAIEMLAVLNKLPQEDWPDVLTAVLKVVNEYPADLAATCVRAAAAEPKGSADG